MTGIFVTNLIIAAGLNFVTQAIQIGAYAARYAGVTTGRIATAISLFSLLVTASRLASLFMTPALGGLADSTANPAIAAHLATVAPDAIARFDLQARLIVAGGSAGILLGGFLLPLFLVMFVRGISAFERFHSIPRALARLFDPRVLVALMREIRPRRIDLADFPRHAVPSKLLIANTLLFAVYAVGVVAAYYASVLDLDARTTATGLSGLVNGIGTIAFSLFVDPTTALIVDRAARGERPRNHVSAMIFWLVATAFLGTLLAQVILAPAAWYIAAAAHLFVHPSHGI
jgi:Alternate to MurJ